MSERERARPTRRSCTPASTPRPGPSRRASSPAATRCCVRTPPTVGISVGGDRRTCSWRGTTSKLASLPSLAAKAAGERLRPHAEIVDVAGVYDLEPHLGPGATGGMIVPDEWIIDPWSTPLAFAYEAVGERRDGPREPSSDRMRGRRGADHHRHRGRERPCEHGSSSTPPGCMATRSTASFGLDGFTIRPRRGELIVFDKLSRPLLNRIVLPVPTATTKGVLVAPTVFGNIMLGPTAEDIDDKTATGSTRAGIAGLLAKGRRILPALLDEEVTAVYAGLRAATEHSDYQVSHERDLRYVCLGGIRAPG